MLNFTNTSPNITKVNNYLFKIDVTTPLVITPKNFKKINAIEFHNHHHIIINCQSEIGMTFSTINADDENVTQISNIRVGDFVNSKTKEFMYKTLTIEWNKSKQSCMFMLQTVPQEQQILISLLMKFYKTWANVNPNDIKSFNLEISKFKTINACQSSFFAYLNHAENPNLTPGVACAFEHEDDNTCELRYSSIEI